MTERGHEKTLWDEEMSHIVIGEVTQRIDICQNS